jgi:hypothetical protein
MDVLQGPVDGVDVTVEEKPGLTARIAAVLVAFNIA